MSKLLYVLACFVGVGFCAVLVLALMMWSGDE